MSLQRFSYKTPQLTFNLPQVTPYLQHPTPNTQHVILQGFCSPLLPSCSSSCGWRSRCTTQQIAHRQSLVQKYKITWVLQCPHQCGYWPLCMLPQLFQFSPVLILHIRWTGFWKDNLLGSISGCRIYSRQLFQLRSLQAGFSKCQYMVAAWWGKQSYCQLCTRCSAVEVPELASLNGTTFSNKPGHNLLAPVHV